GKTNPNDFSQFSNRVGIDNDTRTDQFELQGLQRTSPIPTAQQNNQRHHGHNYNSLNGNASFASPKENAVLDLAISEPPSSSKSGQTTSSNNHYDATQIEFVRAKVSALLRQRFLVHEYTVPRFFVVLPVASPDAFGNDKDGMAGTDARARAGACAGAGVGTGTGTGAGTGTGSSVDKSPSTCRFRLYFLCECSASFTLPLGSGLNHLHIAKHPGYGIEPDMEEELFRRYGTMVLMLLIFLRHGYDPSNDNVPTSHKSAPPKHFKDDPQIADAKEALLKRVNRISSLKAADLPDAIARQVEQRVDGMIAYLEQLRKSHQDSSNLTNSIDSGAEMGSKVDENKSSIDSLENQPLQGITSLSDLHQLYTFIGLSTVSKRVQSGQLANLYRISNARGQVSWVCVYHYRWTFLEKNIDDFEHWIVTRRGHFDKQTGSVSMTLVSRANTRTFCSWITNKVAPSLVEAHIKLGWKFGKKDLWRLANALASSTVTVLSLDGCSFAGHSNYKSIHKKYDPILYLLSHGQLRSLELIRFPSMFSRISSKAVKATSLRRLEFGLGMSIESRDRESFSQFIRSCTSLQELILPATHATGLQMQAIISGVRATTSLVTLDLSNSDMDEGAAIILAQGLFNSHIAHLDLSRNVHLSDIGAARIIRAIGPRLTSLKMAQTGFGDMAAVALSKSMDGISITSTLQDQLMMQHRLDIAALTAGHRPGLRFKQDPMLVTTELRTQVIREKVRSAGCLVYLDIEDNDCSVKGFRALALVKSQLYLVYLNLSGSQGLEDNDCAAILDRVASAELRTLRLSCTGFGDISAQALVRSLSRFQNTTNESGPLGRDSTICQLEELDLHGCPISSSGFTAISEELCRARVSSRIKSLDLGHCGGLEDEVAHSLLKGVLLPNGSERVPIQSEQFTHHRLSPESQSLLDVAYVLRRGSSSVEHSILSGSPSANNLLTDRSKAMLVKSDSVPVMPSAHSDITDNQLSILSEGAPILANLYPPRNTLHLPRGFFANLRQLNFKSTQIGDNTAWLLAQALVQPWIMISSLALLEPTSMTSKGMCWIIEALCDNSSVQDFAIGKSNLSFQVDIDLFGSSLVNLMELNKRIRSLTVLGAPLGSVAKGLLLNQSLHSIYIIRSRGQPDDVQLMGQALSFNRSLLIFWMGGTDESLLGIVAEQNNNDPDSPDISVSSAPSSQRQQQRHQQEQQEQEHEHENMYRNFHILQQQEAQDQRRIGRRPSLGYGQSISQKISEALKAKIGVPSKELHSHTNTIHSKQYPSMPASTIGRTMTGINDDNGMPSSPWVRNPIIEGIRRNHSLIKVTVDILSHSAGSSAGGARGRQGGVSRNGSIGTATRNSMMMEFNSQEHMQWTQQQQVDKIIYANRKNLRERARIGWEELKLLGVDEDVIREVFMDVQFLKHPPS
ncbi:hypothetical protein FBU30_008098, partial [Linnemannia zychae]